MNQAVLAYYNTLNISLSFYFSLIQKESRASSVRSLSNCAIMRRQAHYKTTSEELFLARCSINDKKAQEANMYKDIIDLLLPVLTAMA